jgi:DNA polymerase-3 subunit gamma/tau
MSENYIVSARKYRPQTFDTVVGQEHITTTLKNAIRHNHLAHAYLFCGPRGVGKTTCARILAKTINCENPTPDMEACGVCNTCKSFKDNTSFNVFELDAASNNSVDDIRNLTDQVRFAPQQGRYKIYIIDEVHMLSASAFNAFLKTLEEPPPYAIFILATTEKHKILPTILSRCQIFDFKRITTHDIVNHLHSIATKESVVAQEAALHVIAQKSEGCMRDALSMLDRIVSFTNGMLTYSNTMEHLNMLDADFYFRLTDSMLSQDVSGTLLQLDDALERGFEGDVILEGLSEHMRNLLLCKDARMAKLLDVPNEHKPMYHEKANQAPPSFVLSALNILNDSELNYKNANNKRLHVEICLIRLCYVLQATQADSVKKNSEPLPASSAPQPIMQAAPVAAPVKQAPPPQPAPVVYETKPQPVSVAQEPEPVKQQPAASAQPAPQQPQQAPLPQRPASGTNGARRISKNLMADIDNALNSSTPIEENKELTHEKVLEVFEIYKQKVKDENRAMFYAELLNIFIETHLPDEVRFITPTDWSNTNIMNERDKLIEFFRKHTGVMVLRVKAELRINPELEEKQKKTVMSKQDMYEAMVQKNPNLALLKDGLNLQIEY